MTNLLKDILQNGYKGKKQSKLVDGFTRDDTLSGQRVQVYHNNDTNKTIVSHRGTQGFQDVITDAKLLFNPSAYRSSKRYKFAKKIQDQATAKYGADNITTVAHSLGSSLGSDIIKNSNGNGVFYNKPVTFQGVKKVNPNELDIRTKYDPISILQPYLDKTKRMNVKSDSLLDSHSTDQLKNLKTDVLLDRTLHHQQLV